MIPILLLWPPKTAGSSIWSCLESLSLSTQRVTPSRPFRDNVTVTTFQHAGIPWLLKHKVLTDNWLEKRWKFGFVRNPWGRLVSIYHHMHQGRKDQRRIARREMPDFAGFVDCVCGSVLQPVGQTLVGGLWYANQQDDWLYRPDFVGKVESISQDWKVIQDKLGFIRPLAKINTSKHKPYQEYYTEVLRDKVALRYRSEIERYEYEFDK